MLNEWTDVEKQSAEQGGYVNEYFISFTDQKGNSPFQPTGRFENIAIQKRIFFQDVWASVKFKRFSPYVLG